jgi:hypothetical protein
MRTVFSAIALLVIAAVGMAVLPAPHADAADFGMRGYAIYYNEMKDLTTIYFRQTTAETAYKGSNNWMIRNPNAAGGTSIVLVTQSAADIATYGNVGLTIPPLATFSGKDYRNSVKLYASASTAVELYIESDE